MEVMDGASLKSNFPLRLLLHETNMSRLLFMLKELPVNLFPLMSAVRSVLMR